MGLLHFLARCRKRRVRRVGCKTLLNLSLEKFFGDEPLQTIDCTGTDNRKQRNRTTHALDTQKKQTQENYKTPV